MEASVNPFLELMALLDPKTTPPVLFSARVTGVKPFSVLAEGLGFSGSELQVNAALLQEPKEDEEPPVRAGDSVLCATFNGWQTIYVICKVVTG